MLADTMLAEAYDEVCNWTGALVVLGFGGSLVLAALQGDMTLGGPKGR